MNGRVSDVEAAGWLRQFFFVDDKCRTWFCYPGRLPEIAVSQGPTRNIDRILVELNALRDAYLGKDFRFKIPNLQEMKAHWGDKMTIL